MRFFIQYSRVLNQFVPTGGRVQVYFDHAWVGRDLNHIHAWIEGRRIALHKYGHSQFRSGILNRRDQAKIILKKALRRHKHAQNSITRFRTQCRSNRPRPKFTLRRGQIE